MTTVPSDDTRPDDTDDPEDEEEIYPPDGVRRVRV
jgi:hypothetical protein